MSVYSVWPYFAFTALLLMLAASPLFCGADTPLSSSPRSTRITAFDGLRGFLALAVFFHHGATYHEYLSDNLWLIPSSETFYLLLGKFGVAGFFMVTGFLFWSRIISVKGQLDWVQLYIGRLFRIGPLYLAAAAFMLMIVLVHSGLHLSVPPFKLGKQLIRWLSIGFLKGYDINGSGEPSLILLGAWTLQFEWYFYISLPILALCARSTKSCFPYCAGALVCGLIYIARSTSASLFYSGLTYAEPITLFLAGMTCASISCAGFISRIPDSFTSAIVGIIVILAFTLDNFIHSAGEIILLGGAFYLITAGCSFFGLLTSRSARRLGDVSYGIYILQGLVFSAVFSADWARSIALQSAFGHWCMIFLCAMLLIALATVMHILIERPGIEFGKRLAAALPRRGVGRDHRCQ